MNYDFSRIPCIAASLDAMQQECMITLALKITDDSCKMDDYERSVFMRVYDALPVYESGFFDAEVFDIISEGRERPTAQIFAKIKPMRKAGMDYITRENMKAFKASIRKQLTE